MLDDRLLMSRGAVLDCNQQKSALVQNRGVTEKRPRFTPLEVSAEQ